MFNIPTVTVAKTTLTGTASSVTLTYVAPSVSWTPMHLLVRFNAQTEESDDDTTITYVLNGDDTETNYHRQYLFAHSSTTTVAAKASDNSFATVSGTTTTGAWGSGEILFTDALSTRSHKASVSFSGAAEDAIRIHAGRWANTAAITSVAIASGSGDFKVGSTFELCVVDESFNIDEQIKGSDGTFTVSSIGAANGDLVCIGNFRGARSESGDSIRLELNGDTTAANYTSQNLQGAGSSVASGSMQDMPQITQLAAATADTSATGGVIAQFNNFSDGANDRVVTALGGYHGLASGDYNATVTYRVMRWNNTSAVTSFRFFGGGATNLLSGSMLSTYAVPKNLIARQEISGDTAAITFSDIPQTYDHLELTVYARADHNNQYGCEVYCEFNGDTTATNYHTQRFRGLGSSPSALSQDYQPIGGIASEHAGANIFGVVTSTIYNYTKTDRHKQYLSSSGNPRGDATAQAMLRSNRWADTSAITAIVLYPQSSTNFMAGSVFELRGINADIAPVAGSASAIEKLNGIAATDIEAIN